MLTISFKPEALAKMEAYIAGVDSEISGFGKTEYDPYTDSIIVLDVMIAPQRVTGVTTTLDRDGLAAWQMDLDKAGDSVANWRLWWHSHVNMGVFWSGTDTASINDFDLQRPEDNYMVSIVANKKGEFKCRLDLFAPFRIVQDDLPYQVEPATIDYAAIDADIKRCIIKEALPAISGGVNITGQFTGKKKGKNKKPLVDYDLDELLASKSDREKMIAFYWGQYIKGEFLPLTAEEYNKWYTDYKECFYKNEAGLYIPIQPSDKRVRTAIYKEVRFVDGGGHL